ncbi:glucose-6-phosphate isomerase [Pelagibacterales bacterium SAG-MED16]|jgi:glucose-6-phosphate isomerase|nr:glucose-6-phosphate isomerase [Pelagibacterales bacterium SAG-MED16]
MFSKNIIFKNFQQKKNIKEKKKINNILKKELISSNLLLNSFNKNYKYSYKKKILNKYKNFDIINLIGMGGSILGTEAVYDFLKFKIKKKINFYNDLDSKINFKNKKKTLNLIVSKSGNTLETISNFNVILNSQKKNKNIVITEKKLSFLTELGNKLKADIIEHKNYIGGRYSVLSEVGMLPAELLGLNEKKFKRLNYLIKNKYFINQLIYNVNFIFDCVSNGKKNSVILNYDESSNNLFKWYQQLTAESLGKKNKGIFPIISSMPKDNHSLLQLYLDGPKNNFFTFFGILNEKTIKLSNKNLFDKFSILKNKNLNQIIKAQRQATQKVFKRKKIPFRSFEILRRNEETVGELFTFFVLETILLGRLMEVNPFDQPSVELIKTETSKLLI